ncbi:hypothetical protein [Streptomyces acidiscabies]|uniref:hypothetical protein n=1 Tax=Streptomyces acidiscabies TaxID=42234 RepID=UPI000966E714|nr:hypothetical protein [Streptomyces acidiscabies]GAV38245.1 hypothetical protein Saa2_01124 [Streptomyces acidiscabies]
MTGHREPLARAELAGLLSDAAQSVSEILTTEYPTPPGRSYLHPVLGALSAGPRVVRELNDQLEQFVADESLPTTPAGLLALASYASALGWLTESLAELTVAVDQICTRVGIPAPPTGPSPAQPAPEERDAVFGLAFSAPELEAIRAAAEAADLPPGDYIEVLSASLLAASTITDACMEISNALLEDAAYVLDEAADHVRTGNGPDGLPTLVRSLLARLEAAG